MIRDAERTKSRKRMRVMQMKVYRFVRRGDCLNQIKYGAVARVDGRFDIGDDLPEQRRLGLQLADILAIVVSSVGDACGSYTDMADVNAGRQPLEIGDLREKSGKLGRLQSDSVLDKKERTEIELEE